MVEVQNQDNEQYIKIKPHEIAEGFEIDRFFHEPAT